ncbi:hypothetical protein SAMN04488558_1124 [Ignavigranum ruoffiae]|uniref:Uncharacterized protein n=1 Tax=Ignavigranum ruoffiae TaxID=89093 RepID=A0A1H9G884_9LACT|nr:hypothetical protein [Ignavigranum ruoffiae]SEQ46312.1 hypothetical protein SAMN04488558_1124 [Ignavigranum ruoffiae]
MKPNKEMETIIHELVSEKEKIEKFESKLNSKKQELNNLKEAQQKDYDFDRVAQINDL